MIATDISVSKQEVENEFYRSTERFQVITCWVGVVLNLVWFISDYFIIPDYWIPFLLFRASVSGITALILLSKKFHKLNIYMTLFVLVLGISIQNAYMWSVMDLEHLQKHAFAYMVLFIGVGMLVYWDFIYSIILLIITVICNIAFYAANSNLSVDQFVISGGLLVLTVALFSAFLIRTRYRLTLNEIRSRLELAKSKEVIEEERNTVVEQKKEITDSINYAKRIQRAFIPTEIDFNKHFADSFVLFQPKDIVSGDFYWVRKKDDFIYYATGDCTGHGVPGGFMTMLGLSFLEEIIDTRKSIDPAEILNLLRDKIINTLKQGASTEENKDGMDIVLCGINTKTNELQYAAANNSFYVVRNNEIMDMKADKQPCGFFHDPKPFTTQKFQLEKGDIVYTFTDGYADQFGGPKGKKFRYKQFEEIILTNHTKKFQLQKDTLMKAFYDWKGNMEQTDDVLVIGVKIN
ncbi:MAG: SpoIIE family protein phosphatase [Bacteroidetes bacterium]|nr:SpoIIE family protein phosphatase [Bacteroidota bacterium]